jgi:hypothetical protein
LHDDISFEFDLSRHTNRVRGSNSVVYYAALAVFAAIALYLIVSPGHLIPQNAAEYLVRSIGLARYAPASGGHRQGGSAETLARLVAPSREYIPDSCRGGPLRLRAVLS